MKTEKYDAIVLSSSVEKDAQGKFVDLLKSSPLPDDEIFANLGLYLTSKNLSRLLFFYEIYKKIIHTHGQDISVISHPEMILLVIEFVRHVVSLDFHGIPSFTIHHEPLMKNVTLYVELRRSDVPHHEFSSINSLMNSVVL